MRHNIHCSQQSWSCTLKSSGTPKNWNIIFGGVRFPLFCGKLCCKPDGREMNATVPVKGSSLMKIYRSVNVHV